MSSTFLTAEWRKLAIVNYKVEPGILKKYLPYKTELDFWNGTCYVSLVGFMFQNVRIKGIKIPFHSDFEEVNLRFYVKHRDETAKKWRRGVVFIKEIVPMPAIAFIANKIYKENYEAVKMNHSWKLSDNELEIEYRWNKGGWNKFRVTAAIHTRKVLPGSEEEFITEHYLGYTKAEEKKTFEYEVEHPRWNFYDIKNYEEDIQFGTVFGQEFEFIKREKPLSVFLAEGSEIKISGKRTV